MNSTVISRDEGQIKESTQTAIQNENLSVQMGFPGSWLTQM